MISAVCCSLFVFQHQVLIEMTFYESMISSSGHRHIVDRLRRSLYYGKVKKESEVTECPSLPLTEATVDMFERVLKRESGCGRESLEKSISGLDLNYASSLSRKASISPCSIVVALIYIERLAKQNPDYVKTASPCDLFLVSLLVASKFLFDDGEDEQVLNGEWAASGSLDLNSLNRLELDFLIAMDWDLHVQPALFFEKLAVIELLVTWKQTQLRSTAGGYTYQELLSLERGCFEWNLITEHVIKTIALTFLTYSVVLVAVLSASLVAGSFHAVLSTRSEQQKQPCDRISFPLPAFAPFDNSTATFRSWPAGRCRRQTQNPIPKSLVLHFCSLRPFFFS